MSENNLRENIHQIKILDILVPHINNKTTKLYGVTGGVCDPGKPLDISQQLIFPPRGLKPWGKEINVDNVFHIDSDLTGRSSNKEIPIWLYAQPDSGLWLGIEWSGCWNFEIKRLKCSSQIQIGLPTFDFTMLQGEEIELPAVAFGLYEGNTETGFNVLRNIVREYYLPAIEGKKPEPSVVFQGFDGLPAYQDEQTLYTEADRAAEIGCEAFVLDAGWNLSPKTVEWWKGLGNWEPSHERFPRGMVRFADYIHNKGMKFGLWIEPRARQDSKALNENKSLFLPPPNVAEESQPSPFYLLDLGRQEAQDFFIKQLEQLIVKYKADWIWFDFNTSPRTAFWNCYEKSNRKGLMELGFYQGLYKVFGTIRQKYPHIWIETCASGGRLIDLGLLQHSHSIWLTDQTMNCDQNRNYRGGMNRFLPAVYLQSAFFINPEVLQKKPNNTKLGAQHLLTSFGGAFQFGQGLCFWKESEIKTASKYVSVYKEYRHYLEKDFYGLFPFPESKNAWDGWQFHDRETESGILIIFRLKDSKDNVKIIRPRGLKDNQIYSYSVIIGNAEIERRKAELKVCLSPDMSVIVHYKPKRCTNNQ